MIGKSLTDTSVIKYSESLSKNSSSFVICLLTKLKYMKSEVRKMIIATNSK